MKRRRPAETDGVAGGGQRQGERAAERPRQLGQLEHLALREADHEVARVVAADGVGEVVGADVAGAHGVEPRDQDHGEGSTLTVQA